MKQRGRLFTWVGIGLAIVAFFLVQATTQTQEPQAVYPEVPVLVVEEGLTERARDLGTEEEATNVKRVVGIVPARTVLRKALETKGALGFRYTRADYVPPGAIVITGTVNSPSDLIPKWGNYITLVDLQTGNLVEQQMLARFDGLQRGMRAVSLPVNQVTSVGGTIQTGDHVDVVVSYINKLADGSEVPVTQMFLQDVLVLAGPSKRRYFLFTDEPTNVIELVPRDLSSEFRGDGALQTEDVITLALTPEGALRLTYMSNFAKEVRLIVRPLEETGREVRVEPVTVEGISR